MLNEPIRRREFLGLGLAGALAFLGLKKGYAQEGTGKWDVSYLWHPDLEGLLDYQEDVGRILGAEVRKELKVVKGKENYGLVYDRDGEGKKTRETAKRHSQILRKKGLEGAVAIRDEGYESLYNVSYGMGPNLEVLKKDFGQVYGILGEGVGKNLFIEKVNKEYALVYRRRGEKRATAEAAEKHAALLKSKGIKASIIRENNNRVVYGLLSLLDEEAEEERKTEKKKEEKREEKKEQKEKEKEEKKEFLETTALKEIKGEGKLEEEIEKYVKKLREEGKLAGDEKTAWLVYDFTTGEKLVSINEGEKMQSASIVKLSIVATYLHKVEQGELKYDKKAKKKLEASIQKSSNAATNWVIKQVGGAEEVQKILKDNYGGIFKETEIKENIPAGGRTYKNKASAHDYSRFLYALWQDKLPYAKELRRLMALPGRDRLYTGARKVPAGTLVYNKTGSTARLCGDMGILVAKGKDGKKYPYTLVGIIEKEKRAKNYGGWIAARGGVIREVSNKVYEFMKEKHGLR